MLGGKQKRKFDFRTLRLDDAVHLFGGIPDRHIPSTSARGAAWGRRADMNEHFLSFSRKTETAKEGVQNCAMNSFGHGPFSLLPIYLSMRLIQPHYRRCYLTKPLLLTLSPTQLNTI